MFAVIKTGGKQYRVENGQELVVEKLEGDAGDKISLDEILLVNDGKKTSIGSPIVKDATVSAEIIEQKKGDKVIVFKKKRRHNYRRKKGHRQNLTVLKITNISTKTGDK